MPRYLKKKEPENHSDFDFDYNHNVIFFHDEVIHLSPHESDILKVLLTNRARPIPTEMLIRRVYGASEPDTAGISIRVAIHSLRKKIQITGMTIRAEPRVGYEIDATHVPDLNRRLSDKILMALNMAYATNEPEIAERLEKAYLLAEIQRERWVRAHRG